MGCDKASVLFHGQEEGSRVSGYDRLTTAQPGHVTGTANIQPHLTGELDPSNVIICQTLFGRFLLLLLHCLVLDPPQAS